MYKQGDTMPDTTTNPLECCTANSLARDVTRMGEEAFAGIGMTSYAFCSCSPPNLRVFHKNSA
jgi:hypothetical protein